MSLTELQGIIKAAKPAPKDKCASCGASLEKLGSVSATITIFLKKTDKKVCLLCAKEIRALIDLRISQVEKGEYSA